VFLDEGIFEDQRLFFGVGDDRPDLAYPAHQETYMGAAIAFRGKIRTQAAAQVLCLADVENLARLSLHQVDAGKGGELFQVDFLHDSSRKGNKKKPGRALARR